MSFLLASLILIIPLVEIWILIQIGIAGSLNAVFFSLCYQCRSWMVVDAWRGFFDLDPD